MAIEQKAEKKLQDLGISHPNEIDLEAIAFIEGVSVKYAELNGCEARLVGVKDKAIVTIDNSVEERRKRFSLAHELGHWNCHRGRSFECRIDGFSSKNLEEREADQYAASILMPKYLFRKEANLIKKPNFDAIIELSDTFNTSLTSTAIRLVQINLWPIIIVCHSKEGKRIWYKMASDIPCTRWHLKKIVGEDSIAYDRLKGEDRVKDQMTDADCWFDSDEADKYIIMEDSITIFDDKVLTLLWLNNDEMLEEV